PCAVRWAPSTRMDGSSSSPVCPDAPRMPIAVPMIGRPIATAVTVQLHAVSPFLSLRPPPQPFASSPRGPYLETDFPITMGSRCRKPAHRPGSAAFRGIPGDTAWRLAAATERHADSAGDHPDAAGLAANHVRHPLATGVPSRHALRARGPAAHPTHQRGAKPWAHRGMSLQRARDGGSTYMAKPANLKDRRIRVNAVSPGP